MSRKYRMFNYKAYQVNKKLHTWQVMVAFMAIFIVTAVSSSAQDSVGSKSLPLASKAKLNPSNWLQQAENAILLFESKLVAGIDSTFMAENYQRLIKDFELTTNDFKVHGEVMRIRTLDDVKAKLLQQKMDLDKWRNAIRRQNDALAGNYLEIENMEKDSTFYVLNSDSSLWQIYEPEFRNMEANLAKVGTQYQDILAKTVAIENNLNTVNFRISRAIMAVENELAQRNAALFHRTHPAFWELSSNTYKDGIGTVFMQTLNQNLDSLKFYGKNAYIRMILFRVLILLITLLPVFYFKKHKNQFKSSDKNQPYKFVHKYTGASTSSFILVMAPFIFVNSPHIFTEVILITLAFTTSIIFLKEQPGINKKYFYAILALYVILKAMNLMVSVTYFGRIVWTLSLIGIVPIYKIYHSIGKTTLTNKNVFRVVLIITSFMFITGWILNFTGHYPLGRILLLAGLDQFFLAIVLYVAIYSLIDFIAILANIYNASHRLTTIRVDLIYNKLLNLVRILATILWFYSFLANVNSLEFLRQNVFTLLEQQFTIAGISISPGSILIFFVILFFAIYLSSMLDGMFYDEKRSEDSEGKTSLGSIVIILRLFVISGGFILGMVIAGIPLNNLTLFVSALGVGIGFGLQSLISNLLSGIIIAFEKPVYVGDIIEVDGTRGRVTDIGLRATTVDTTDGAEFIVPNGEMISKVLKNWTLTTKHFKVETSINTDTDTDPGKVIDIVKETFKDIPKVFEHPKPSVTLTEILPHSLHFSISWWVNSISEAKDVRNEMLTRIHAKFKEAGVKYPKHVKE